MNDLHSTNDLLEIVEQSRDATVSMSRKNLERQEKIFRYSKYVYWSIVGVALLHLIFLSLSLLLSPTALVNLKGSEVMAVAKKGQTTSTLTISIIVVKNYDFEDIEVGDYVIVYNDVDEIYMEKQVTSIDYSNEIFEASYTGQTLDDYQIDDFVGVYKKDAGFFQLFTYGMSTLRGFIGTFVAYTLIAGISYYIVFKKPYEEEDSDTDE